MELAKLERRYIWVIVTLVGLYVTAQLVADVAATRLVEISGVVLPAGSIMFAVTFTLRDIIHKRLGKEWARASIVAAAGFNVLLALYLAAVGRLDAPVFYAFDQWGPIFSLVPAITLGSIIAELISETIDTEVYHFWKTRFERWPQWTRVLASNAVSIPVDSFVFSLMAFVVLPPVFGAAPIPLADALVRVVSGQVLYKAIVTLISMPLIYTVKDKPIAVAAQPRTT